MENKYYVPNIEEFHIGFKYYEDIGRGIYEQQVYDGEIITSERYVDCYGAFYDSIEDSINFKMIKVKYLDKEDIESLGFEKSPNNENLFWRYKGDFEIQLSFDNKAESKELGIGISIYKIDLVFNGYCKNKSELKKILKQLGIYEATE